MTTPVPSEVPGSKADALEWLKSRLVRSRILDLFWFRAADWQTDSARILQQVTARFPQRRVIVRSSALDESNAESSNSGVNDSVTNVDSGNPVALEAAIRLTLKQTASAS